MNAKDAKGNVQIRAFKKSLGAIVGEANVPPHLTGDLSMLLDAWERGIRLLRKIRNGSVTGPKPAPAALLELELLLGEDLKTISRNLLPSLRKVRRQAYLAAERRVESGRASSARRRAVPGK